MAQFSYEDLLAHAAENGGMIEATVFVDFYDVVGHTTQGFLRLLSQEMIGSDRLEDISYTPLGITEDEEVKLHVRGSIVALLEETNQWQELMSR